jgi:2-haloacid dehalogenase
LGYYKPSLQSYLRAVELLGLQASEAVMIAAHEGDLAAAQAAGLHTAYVIVPEKDNVGEGFGQPGTARFDLEAKDFDELCRKLGA